ncbi:two-component system phosphate regulon sensor histidine kinase PhoR [Rhizobium etli]|uniref:histidine kinase n=1 Tax=Rhizobium etli TaxID=29449 RepID=A0A7W7ED56_RHIET|nr:two-component system phosphate regulon sensor histidine kinase PhoR [Rhizobium etli]MBB4534587.1 two-component system phosphate regulon sensor histidine kinase PhoR [Rhizobium etli]
MPDEIPWKKSLLARIRRERPVLLAAILSALVALAAGMNKWVVLVLLLVMVLTALFNEAPVLKPEPAEPVEPEPEAPPSRLPDISATLAGLDIPVMVLSDDASVLFQNRAAEKAFGEVTLGAHISARLRSPGVLDMVRETIATNAPNQIEHAERLPSERVYIVRSAPVEFQADGQRERFFILSFRDISEVRRIDRMRSDFVANASHELRTPLASLRGFIETIQGPAKNDQKAQAQFLGIMFDQTTRMSRLVDDLLSLSRLELKSHIAPDEKVDLVPLLGHVRDSLVPLARDVGVDINLHLPDGKVEVLGDRDELVQVFENLMENACKYGQEGKVVDVRLKNGAGGPVEVSIIDKGPGIPAEHVPRLTERFYRVSIEDSRSKKGTGLGLAIVKHILTRHRARLIVKSEVGKGTDFTVRF